MPSRTTPRSAASTGRFARQPGSSPARFGRQPAPARFGRPAASGGRVGRQPAPARFSRPAASGGRFGRHPAPASRFAVGRRRQAPKRSKPGQMMKSIAAALPGLARGRSKSRGGGRRRAGGMAVLAGGVGLAMKNRNKLAGMMGRRSSTGTEPPPTGV
jgi:hypothetical protein